MARSAVGAVKLSFAHYPGRRIRRRSRLGGCYAARFAGICFAGICFAGICFAGICFAGICFAGILGRPPRCSVPRRRLLRGNMLRGNTRSPAAMQRPALPVASREYASREYKVARRDAAPRAAGPCVRFALPELGTLEKCRRGLDADRWITAIGRRRKPSRNSNNSLSPPADHRLILAAAQGGFTSRPTL
jgi:hypothetical protein